MSGMVMLVAGCTETAHVTAPVQEPGQAQPNIPSRRQPHGVTVLSGPAADSAMWVLAHARARTGDSSMLLLRRRLHGIGEPARPHRAISSLEEIGAPPEITNAFTLAVLSKELGGPVIGAEMYFKNANLASNKISYNLSGAVNESNTILDEGTGTQPSMWDLTRVHATYIRLGNLPNCNLQLSGTTVHRAWYVGSMASSTIAGQSAWASSRDATSRPACQVKSIILQPSSSTISAGGSATVAATVYDQYDEPNASLCSSFDWSSSNQQVAVVGSDGTVSGLSPGSATISASCGGVTGTTDISVVCPGSGASDATVADGDPCNTGSGSSGGTSPLPTGGYWIRICETTYYGEYNPYTGIAYITSWTTTCWDEWKEIDVIAIDGKPRAPDDVLLVASGATRDSAPARLVRRASGEHRDVIVVDTTRATARDLAGAVAILQAHRAAGVPVPASGAHSVVTSFTPSAAWERSARASFEALLAALERQPVREISGYGPRRALSVAVPGIQVRRQ